MMNTDQLDLYAKEVATKYLQVALSRSPASIHAPDPIALREAQAGLVLAFADANVVLQRPELAARLVAFGVPQSEVATAQMASEALNPTGSQLPQAKRPWYKNGFLWGVVGVAATGIVAYVIVEHGK